MNAPIWTGVLTFFLVPAVLWLAAALGSRRRGRAASAWAVVVGGDNRLSLARLQAWTWTLVIFGSYAAAMLVHERIPSRTPTAAKTLQERAQNALQLAKERKEGSDRRTAASRAAADNAEQRAMDAETKSRVAAARAAVATPESKAAAEKEAADAAAKSAAERAVATELAGEAQMASSSAIKAAEDLLHMQEALDRETLVSTWVAIPATLLALAGIALGSGVFSSLISAVTDEQKPGQVTSIVWDPNTASFVVKGIGLGTDGSIRIGKREAVVPPAQWTDTVITFLDPHPGTYDVLVVDTTRGKLAYDLNRAAQPSAVILGPPTQSYEFADLFRDDKSPDTFSLMKFQMFGWTIVAVSMYVGLFLRDLAPILATLPIVPESLVILTGLSQAGYLTGKGVSNVGKPST